MKIAFLDEAIPTTFNFKLEFCFNSSYWLLICSMSLPPTVPMPQIKRFSTLYSDKKSESWSTFSAFLRSEPFTTNEIFISDAPCAIAITLIPERPRTSKSLPLIPGVRLMFSPTTATVASPLSACIGNIRPSSISSRNSSLSTFTALSASSSFTPIEVLFSEAACDTRKTLIPLLARELKIRRLTPTTPTIERPVTVITVVPLIDDKPLIGF